MRISDWSSDVCSSDLRRRNGNAVAGMDAHWIDILDRADDDGVIGAVTHDFHLIFFPAEQRFLDQPLARGRCLKAASDALDKPIAIIGNAATGPAPSEGRPNHGGKSRMIQRGRGLLAPKTNRM